jgi:hypothetical protein
MTIGKQLEYNTPLFRNKSWRVKRLKLMQKHGSHANFRGGVL